MTERGHWHCSTALFSRSTLGPFRPFCTSFSEGQSMQVDTSIATLLRITVDCWRHRRRPTVFARGLSSSPETRTHSTCPCFLPPTDRLAFVHRQCSLHGAPSWRDPNGNRGES